MQPNCIANEKELPCEEIQLCNLQLGPLIAKGSNSAVYSARLCSDVDGMYIFFIWPKKAIPLQ